MIGLCDLPLHEIHHHMHTMYGFAIYGEHHQNRHEEATRKSRMNIFICRNR